LSQPSVSRVADALLQADLLVEGDRIASKAGRKQVLLDVNAEAAVVAGLSVRSRFVRLLLTDLKGGVLAQRQVAREPRTAGLLVTQIKDLLDRECQSLKAPLAAVGIGISGVWDEKAGIVHSAPNLSNLENIDLLSALQAELEDDVLPEVISVDNDVNYAALGEYAFGAAQGFDSFFYLNLGSGIGGGNVVKGQLHRGFQGFAGEIGFLPVYDQGHYHTLESLLSRSALASRAEQAELGQTAKELFSKAQQGDQGALELVAELTRQLALALCAIVTVLNPELIVIGGSTGRYSDVLIPNLERQLAGYVPKLPTLVGTALGGDASLRGAVARSLELARSSLVGRELA
jgi:predicted NBD/HSP70 family sugar kinase